MQTKLNRRRCTRNIHCFWSDSVTYVDMIVSRRRLFDSTTGEFIKNSDIPAKPVLTHLPRMQMLYSIRAAAGLEGEGTASSFLPNRKKSDSQAGNKKKKKKSFRRGRNLPWRNDLFEDGLKAAGLSELDAGTKLHVSNLDAGLTNEDIRVLFLEIGELIRYGILFDKNGRPSAHSAVVALDYCGKVLGFQLFQGIWVKLAGTDWVLVKRFYYNIKTKVSGVPLSVPSASEEAVNLITLLCSWDPCKRPTAAEALQHPFFKSCYYVPPFLRPKADLAKTPPSAGIKAALVPKPGKSYSGTLLNPKCSNKLNKPLVPPHAGIQRKFGDDSSGGTKIFETGGCCAWEEGEEHLGDSGCSIF